MTHLNSFKVAVLATDGFEQSELKEPVNALEQSGAVVHVLSPGGREIQGFVHHDKAETLETDGALEDADPDDYDGLLLPGGALNADKLRMDPQARRFVQAFDRAGKPIAAICHAPWLLVSAGLVKGRTLAGYYTIQDDVRNAGGNWVDRETVRDANWVTSRQPKDLPAFDRAMEQLFAEARTEQAVESL